MIDNIGLLTREGMASFYAIFKDQENFRTPSYIDIFPTVPFSDKPRGPNAARDYKRKLEEVSPGSWKVEKPALTYPSLNSRGSTILMKRRLSFKLLQFGILLAHSEV